MQEHPANLSALADYNAGHPLTPIATVEEFRAVFGVSPLTYEKLRDEMGP